MPAKFQRKVKKTYTEDPIYYDIQLGGSSFSQPAFASAQQIASTLPAVQLEVNSDDWVLIDDGNSKFYFNKVKHINYLKIKNKMNKMKKFYNSSSPHHQVNRECRVLL